MPSLRNCGEVGGQPLYTALACPRFLSRPVVSSSIVPSPCHSPSVSLLIGRTELSDSLDDALQQDYLLLHWNRIAPLPQQQRQSAVEDLFNGSPFHRHGPQWQEAAGGPAVAGRHACLRPVRLQPVWCRWSSLAEKLR